jgi:predicted small integral membrane protein
MSSLPSTPLRRSPVLTFMDVCEKAFLRLFVAGLMADAIALSCLPMTTSGFWWAILLNLVGTVSVALGVPLWDTLRRRVG